MVSEYRTEQEVFWAGEFGSAYIARNAHEKIVAANTAMFSSALRRAPDISTILEFGANIGLNLRSLRHLYPEAVLKGIEINQEAADVLSDLIGSPNVVRGSLLDYEPTELSDLVLIKGVLIHMNPSVLDVVYDKLYKASKKYILVVEYFNPTPVSITYRGHQDRLFKRDFAGEILDRFSELSLVDYGFVYRRDPSFPLDDVTWFLLSK